MLNYAVEYRGVKTKEEKGVEQIEEQRVIEAQIRMRHQELQDDAERLKNKQVAASTDEVAIARVEPCDTGGTSTPAASDAQGNDAVSGQVQHSELLLKNAERLRQLRDNNFDMDLEEVMLMEAIWLSVQLLSYVLSLVISRFNILLSYMRINLEFADSLKSEFVAHHLICMLIVVMSAGSQDQEALGNPGSIGAVPPTLPLRCYDASGAASAEAAPPGGFACAVAALAEQQHMLGDPSSAATCQASRHDILSRSQRSFTEDLSIAGSSSSATRVEEPSNGRTPQARDGADYSNNDGWSEAAEASTSCARSHITIVP
uniref:Uncharacterized protein n=1 Tax=Aegilops tauschii TaxID=37682 RepID=M8AQ49_AEGTA